MTPSKEALEALAHDVERAAIIEFHSGDREPGAQLSENGKQQIARALRIWAALSGDEMDLWGKGEGNA